MRKAQFFIGTMVLVALSISIITNSLSIPKELKYDEFDKSLNNLRNVLFVKDILINSLDNYFLNDWLLPYDYRTVIKTYNNRSLNDDTVMVALDLPDDIHEASIILIDKEHNRIPFGIVWIDASLKLCKLYFASSQEALENKIYYLYYNKFSGSNKDNSYPESLINYEDTSEYLSINTGVYSLIINKSLGGALSNLNISGEDSSINFIESRLKCGGTYYNLTKSVNQDYSLKDNKYFIELTITGSRQLNTSHVIKEYFFPDRIIISDYLTAATNLDCNAWEFVIDAKKSMLSNYVDSSGNNYEPTPIQPESSINAGNFFEFYLNDYSLGGLISEATKETLIYSSSNNNGFQLRAENSSPIIKGEHNHSVTIIPGYKRLINNSLINYEVMTECYNEEQSVESATLLNVLKNYFTQSNSFVTALVSNDKTREFYNNKSGWASSSSIRTKVMIWGGNIKNPVIIRGDFIKNFDPGSFELRVNNGLIVSQLSTDNYLSSSVSPRLNNTGLNNSLLLLNVDGSDFNISINKLQSGSLSANLYLPNGSLIDYYDVSSDFYTISVQSLNYGGFYNLTLNGSNPDYYINSTLPKTVVGLPAQFIAGELIIPAGRGVNQLSFNITTTSATARLIDYLNKTLDTKSGSEIQLSSSVYSCLEGCNYRVSLNNESPIKLESNINYACLNELYCINPDNPVLDIVSYALTTPTGSKSYYYYSTDSMIQKSLNPTDLVYNTSPATVNSSYYSFDLDNLIFRVNGVDWSHGWTTCDPVCTNGFNNIEFLEKGPARVVIGAKAGAVTNYIFHFYYNTSIFDVYVNSSSEVIFGPDFEINDSKTDYYDYYNYQILPFNATSAVITKSVLTAPRSYVRRLSEGGSLSVIFDTIDLSAHNSIFINDTTTRIKTYKPSTYRFIINESPLTHLGKASYNDWRMSIEYNITSFEFTLSEKS